MLMQVVFLRVCRRFVGGDFSTATRFSSACFFPARFSAACFSAKFFVSVLGLFGLLGFLGGGAELFGQETSSVQGSVGQGIAEKRAADPRIEILQPGVTLTLLAEHPDLVTPTGIGVDSEGNLWVVACHTHFRPSNYQGPEHDEILVFDAQGKNRRVFYNRTKTTMQLLLDPLTANEPASSPAASQEGRVRSVLVAQRDRILRITEAVADGQVNPPQSSTQQDNLQQANTNRDNSGEACTEETIVQLDTVADYPHNGLSGMAWHNDGGLIFSLGENFGKDWVLRGADGVELRGRGEGGVFHCTPDGKNLRRIAKGFWNPFGLWMREDGVLFAAENDPGSRPPCRLLQVVENADYGFQYVYGSAPVHPFVCWNGELKGTLGMIHPCGEGPCAVVGLGGGVMVPSWSNHCIDYFPLHWKGATLTSDRIELLRGSDLFRPVAMVRKSDTEYYFTDWVSPSYELHGMGRLWKLQIDPSQATWMQPTIEPKSAEALLADRLREESTVLLREESTVLLREESTVLLGEENRGRSQEAWGDAKRDELLKYIQGDDPFLADAASTALSRYAKSWGVEQVQAFPDALRLATFVALRKSDFENQKWVLGLWNDSNTEIRFECLRWIADAVWIDFLPQVEKMLKDPALDYRLFEAALATLNTLQGKPAAGVSDPGQLIERVFDNQTSPEFKAFALRLIPPQHASLNAEALERLWGAEHEGLRREVVRTLAMQKSDSAKEKLLQIATDHAQPEAIRLDALAGLIGVQEPTIVAGLSQLVDNQSREGVKSEAVVSEVKRVLRGAKGSAVTELVGQATNSDDQQRELQAARIARIEGLLAQGDTQRGRRLFFHGPGAACSQCHRHSGRGNVVGPDLSLVGRQVLSEAIGADGKPGGKPDGRPDGRPDEKQSAARELLQSIMEPNREVAPQFYTTLLELADGSTFTGILLRSSSTEVYRNNFGEEVTFQKNDIADRKESRTSMMPSGLLDTMSDEEVSDLIAFLLQSK
jgi:putative membrane-bound dehydrogenase-like protein